MGWAGPRRGCHRRVSALLVACALGGCGSAAQAPSSGLPAGSSVVDAGHGVAWLMAGLRVLRTTNDGASWRTVFPSAAAPGSSHSLGAVWFLGRADAWVEQVNLDGFPRRHRAVSTVLWRTTDGGIRWSRARDAPHLDLSPVEIPFDQVSFSGPRSGFLLATALSGGLTVARRVEGFWATGDGGRTWERVAAHDLPGARVSLQNGRAQAVSDPFALAAVSSHEAWLARTHGSPVLWRTVDGGRSWSRVSVPDASGGQLLGAPSFWGRHGVLGIAEPAGRLMADVSDDGGSRWHAASTLATGSLAPPPGFDAVSSTAWVAPAPAGLFETLDGGRRWSLARGGISLGGVSLDDIAQFAFASPSSGLAIGQSAVPGALFTDNAGRSWSPSPFPALPNDNKPPQPIAALAAAAPGLVSDGSTLFLRAGQGQQWKPVLHPSSWLTALSFPNPRDGWAPASAQLFATTDGGATWSARNEPAQGPLVQAQLITREQGVGVVCGVNGGEALKTGNAGRSWQPLTLPSGAQPLVCSGQGTSTLCFTNAANGWALIGDRTRQTLSLLHTTDGGRMWTRRLIVTRAGAGGTIGCRRSTVWASAAGDTVGMWGTPDAVFVSSDDGRHWLDAIASGPHPPSAVGVPLTRVEADGDILNVAALARGTLVLPSACVPCEQPGRPDGTLGLRVSTDGGRRWSGSANPGLRPLPYLGSEVGVGAIAFTSPAHGAILAQSAANLDQLTLIETEDQARTWQRIASFPP